MEEKKIDTSDIDAVLAYRNYLAAEDHLDELIFRATTSEERRNLEAMLDEVIYIRDNIMPSENDPTKHCLVKHFAVGYEAVRERWKDKRTEELYYLKKHAFDLLIDALEMVWGRKIITCERCDYGRNTNEDNRNSEANSGTTVEHGQSRLTVSSAGEDREPVIQGVRDASVSGAKGSGNDSSLSPGEEYALVRALGDAAREERIARVADSINQHLALPSKDTLDILEECRKADRKQNQFRAISAK